MTSLEVIKNLFDISKSHTCILRNHIFIMFHTANDSLIYGIWSDFFLRINKHIAFLPNVCQTAIKSLCLRINLFERELIEQKFYDNNGSYNKA